MGSFMIGDKEFSSAKPAPGLYIVSTPIGNLGDITLRALETLAGADIIACEDTRVTAKLLKRYGISAKRTSYHEHNADKEGPILLDAVRQGKVVALASDAGTPLISDPGQRLVAAAKTEALPVFPIPGVSAPIAALTASGLPTEVFTFAGFLPSKQGQRQSVLQSFRGHDGTLMFFEGPSRLAASLKDMAEQFGGERQACVCRELTKMHEEARLGSLSELLEHYTQSPPKGEIVIVLAPEIKDQILDPETLLVELLETMSVSRAASEAAKRTGLAKRDLYTKALNLAEAKNDQ
ncbi:MAG: 16S rRNA (cytidine(1402)-2'-O)-methyltransferase [Salaquimonas sp.]